MAIFIDKPGNRTVCICDFCGAGGETDIANGVVVEDWMTGHLWLDLSMSEQRHDALAFCPSCAAGVRGGGAISFSLAEVEPEPLPEPTEGSDPTDPSDGGEP